MVQVVVFIILDWILLLILFQWIFDLSRENVHYGYPFERLKTIHLLFAIHS